MKLGRMLPAMVLLSLTAAGSASAATVRVCGHGCEFREVGAAVRAASPGDTVRVAAGTYRGGFAIDKDLRLVGHGAGATVIDGGGPVITIGTWFARREPTVTLAGVRIAGGHTTSSPQGRFQAYGGGVFIVPSVDFGLGAAVTIEDSSITGNDASPASTEPFGPPCPGDKPCPYAAANGGGVASFGSLTLIRTTVAENRAVGSRASDSDGGGIWTAGGSLTIRHSVIDRNLASATPPNGRFAEGGGIFTQYGETVEITDSEIDGNTASLHSTFPFCFCGGQPFEVGVNSGGLHTGDKTSLTIARSRVDHNSVVASALKGEPEVFDSGVCACGTDSPLAMTDTSVSHNRLTAEVGSLEHIFSSLGFSAGGVLEFDSRASVRDAHVSDNSTTVTSESGAALGSGAVSDFTGPPGAVVSDSVISGNTVTATSGSGSAKILGAGVTNGGTLGLRGDAIRDNVGTAKGRTATAQGGGVWNGTFPGGPAVLRLSIERTTVTHNALTGSGSITRQGGGLFTAIPVILNHSRIAANVPDNCFGTAC